MASHHPSQLRMDAALGLGSFPVQAPEPCSQGEDAAKREEEEEEVRIAHGRCPSGQYPEETSTSFALILGRTLLGRANLNWRFSHITSMFM